MEKNLNNPIMERWVDFNGKVNYKDIVKDQWFWSKIEEYKKTLVKELSREDEFAFWLNVYNFYTIWGIIQEYEKNLNFKGNLSLYSKMRFFILRKFPVNNRKLSLNYIEHQILRKKFQDPRIHFAINCGSMSCPFLPNRLFNGATLDKTLDGFTSFFINSGTNIKYDEVTNTLFLNRIFKWYKNDLKKVGGIRLFIKKYLKKQNFSIEKVKIRFMKYDWSVNSKNND